MTMRDFIREHRAEIDSSIEARPGACKPSNDDERRDWIANDEGLYLWARREGVRV